MKYLGAGTLLFGALLIGGEVYVQAQTEDRPLDLSQDPEAQGFADLYFAQGMVEFADRDFNAAKRLFEDASAAWPADATYAYFAALCALRLGRYDEAARRLEKTLPPASNRVPEARVRSDLGEAWYLAGELQAAERELRASVRMDPEDGWPHFYLGLIHFGREEGEPAIEELERAAELAPELAGESSYYLGIKAQQRGDTAAARQHFEATLQLATDKGLRRSGRRWLDAARPPSQVPPPPGREFRLGLSVESDDNPGRINDTLGGLPGADADERSVLQFRFGAQPLVRQDGWTLGLVLNGYASRHRDFEVADQAGGQGVIQAAWGNDPLGYVNGPLGYARVIPGESRFGWILQGGASYFNLDEDSYRRDFEFSGSFLVRQIGFGKTQLDLQYSDRTFLDPFFHDLTGHVQTARLGQYITLGSDPYRYLRLALTRSATSTREEGLDFDSTQFLTELVLPLGGRWTLFVYGSRSEDDYDRDSSLIYGSEREDDRTELSGSAVVGFGSNAYATLRYSWVDQDVSPDASLLSYDRRIASAGLTVYW